MEDDWITNFFDRSRIVSNANMQQLWSRVLAGEANLPGTFAKRTVNVLADLDKRDADLFTTLCGFGWMIDDNVVPLVFDVQNRIYTGQAVTFASLAQLEALGLVTLGDAAGFKRVELPEKATVFYYGRPLELTFPNASQNELQLGKVLLTQAGQELAAICGSKPVDGFWEFMLAKWEKEGLIPSKDTTASCGTSS